jgi:hypothetical protein
MNMEETISKQDQKLSESDFHSSCARGLSSLGDRGITLFVDT